MQPLPLPVYLVLTALLGLAGIWLCGYTARALGVHDHGGIVWDEIVGLLITLIAVPPDWRWLLAGFLLFRLFDILKPWPIRWLDRRVGGGFGIMIDDVLAGLFALLCLHGLIWLLT
jgi:phosphatidylglycerophosphatase A